MEPPTEPHGRETPHHPPPTLIPRPSRKPTPPSTLGNPFHHTPRKITLSQHRSMLQQLEAQQDIPTKLRIQWLEAMRNGDNNPATRLLTNNTIKRLQRVARQPKHQVFFHLDPLIKHVFHPHITMLPLHQLILQLKLTTLMRSIDLSRTVWALFHMDGRFFIKSTDKGGQPTTHTVSQPVLENLISYLYQHKQCPGPYLLRHIKTPHLCLSSQRIAKITLLEMEQAGVNSSHFKSHSLRGATATHFLKMGVPHHLVQARGHWASPQTMDKFYARLHQDQDWYAHLQGGIEKIRHQQLVPSRPATPP